MLRVVVLVVLVGMVVGAIAQLVSLKHPARGYLSRMRDLLRGLVGDSATSFVRSLVPSALLVLWVGIWCAASVAWTSGTAPPSVALVIGGPLVLVVLAALVLVVRYTGRPRWAVPRAFRDMDETELLAWFAPVDLG